MVDDLRLLGSTDVPDDLNINNVRKDCFRKKILGPLLKLEPVITRNRADILCHEFRNPDYPDFIDIDKFI